MVFCRQAQILGPIRSIVFIVVLSLGLASGALAGQLEDGEAAFDRQDYALAYRLLRPLADKGDPTAQYAVGGMYLVGNAASQDFLLGVAWLTKAANQGQAEAAWDLGQLYLDGFGVAPDVATAMVWFRKVAEKEDAKHAAAAQLQLAHFYLGASEDPHNEAEAKLWLAKAVAGFQKGADRGDLESQMALASLYARGEGVVLDKAKAQSLYQAVAASYRKAADQGAARAQFQLAQMYQRGLGLPRDNVQAAIWYRRAADQGNVRAQFSLAGLYTLSGLDLKLSAVLTPHRENRQQAYIWFSLGTAHVSPALAAQSERSLADIGEALTAPQRAEAGRFIREWRPVKEMPGANGVIEMTTVQKEEAERIRGEWARSQAEVDAAEQQARSFDMVLGSPKAKLTVTLYTSASSPQSARFNNEVFPRFRAKYIDTGLVRLVVREFAAGPKELTTDAFLIARCAGANRYFAVLDAIFRNLTELNQAADPRASLLEIARSFGMSQSQFDTCISDQAARRAFDARVKTFEIYDHVSGVPTLVVGDRTLEGVRSPDELFSSLDRALYPASWLAAHALRGPPGLFFRIVDQDLNGTTAKIAPSLGDERVPQADGPDLWVKPGAVITGDMIAEAHVETDENDTLAIGFRLTDEGRRRFSEFTTANIGRPFAIVWNGVILSAPIVRSAITGGSGQITGNFTAQSAQELVDYLMKVKNPPRGARP